MLSFMLLYEKPADKKCEHCMPNIWKDKLTLALQVHPPQKKERNEKEWKPWPHLFPYSSQNKKKQS